MVRTYSPLGPFAANPESKSRPMPLIRMINTPATYRIIMNTRLLFCESKSHSPTSCVCRRHPGFSNSNSLLRRKTKIKKGRHCCLPPPSVMTEVNTFRFWVCDTSIASLTTPLGYPSRSSTSKGLTFLSLNRSHPGIAPFQTTAQFRKSPFGDSPVGVNFRTGFQILPGIAPVPILISCSEQFLSRSTEPELDCSASISVSRSENILR